jgi:hypothetical protein
MFHQFLRSVLFLLILANAYATSAMLRLENVAIVTCERNIAALAAEKPRCGAAQISRIENAKPHIRMTRRNFVMVKGEACPAPIHV